MGEKLYSQQGPLEKGRGPLDNIRYFGPDQAKGLQRRLFTKYILTLCRVEDTEPGSDEAKMRALSKLRQLLKLPANAPKGGDFAAGILDPDFRLDLHKLRKLVFLPTLIRQEDVPAIDEADTLRMELLNNKQGPFWRALTILATGIYACKQASDFIISMKADMAHQRTLDMLLPKAMDLPKLDPKALVLSAANSIDSTQYAEWPGVYKQLCSIEANASSRFMTENQALLDQVKLKIAGAVEAVLFASRLTFRTAADPPLRAVCDALANLSLVTAEDQEPDEALAGTITNHFSVLQGHIPLAASIPFFDKMVSVDEVKAFDLKQSQEQCCLQSCASSASWLITLFAPKLTCDFGSDHATALVDVVRTLENSSWSELGAMPLFRSVGA